MVSPPELLIHATAIAVRDRAAIIRGPSGAGKSDLALRCLATAPSPLAKDPVNLVGDDQLVVCLAAGRLMVRAPATLAGRIEVRGVGIVQVPNWIETGEAVLIVDLVAKDHVARLPDPWPRARLLDRELPVLRLNPFEASAPLKVFLALSDPHFPSQA